MTTKTLHMSITGEAFTNIIRRLWIEGEEFKALNTWIAAFPHLAKPNYLNSIFLDIISGKSSFTGSSSDKDGFTLKNNKKTIYYFEDDKSLPLYDSWNDVFAKYKIILWSLEIDLRNYVATRKYNDTMSSNGYDASIWVKAADENIYENQIRKKHQRLYTNISNIAKLLNREDFKIPLIPTIDVLKTAIANSSLTKHYSSFSNKNRDKVIFDKYDFYETILKIVKPIQDRLISKYGCDPFSNIDFKILCNIIKEDEQYIEDLNRKNARKNELINEVISAENPKTLNTSLVDFEKMTSSNMDDSYYKKTTPYDLNYPAAYIGPAGEYYGVAFQSHSASSYSIKEELGTKYKIPNKGNLDGQSILDSWGFVKITGNEVVWTECFHRNPTEAQIQAIAEYMAARKIKKMKFAYRDIEQTLEEAFNE